MDLAKIASNVITAVGSTKVCELILVGAVDHVLKLVRLPKFPVVVWLSYFDYHKRKPWGEKYSSFIGINSQNIQIQNNTTGSMDCIAILWPLHISN